MDGVSLEYVALVTSLVGLAFSGLALFLNFKKIKRRFACQLTPKFENIEACLTEKRYEGSAIEYHRYDSHHFELCVINKGFNEMHVADAWLTVKFADGSEQQIYAKVKPNNIATYNLKSYSASEPDKFTLKGGRHQSYQIWLPKEFHDKTFKVVAMTAQCGRRKLHTQKLKKPLRISNFKVQ